MWKPTNALHVYKAPIVVDMLGNIAWICPLAPGTSADVLVWDGILFELLESVKKKKRMFWFGMGMDRLVPAVISLILRLGAMTALMKAGCISLCHSLEERMEL